MSTEKITLGGGCFWCIEAIYNDLKGVQSAISGYAGGHIPNPTYQQVCTKTTGHAEVVQITFDPAVISAEQILNLFFTVHDPTTPNRQGNDVGPQYRSVVFYHNDKQKELAGKVMAEHAANWSDPIVTEIEPLDVFYEAEDYHQNYFASNPNQGYCQFVIAPKVAKFRKQYLEMLKR